MRAIQAILGSLALTLVACGEGRAPPQAVEPTAGANTTAGSATISDHAAILSALGLSADAQGQVMNECGELATPQYLPAELGGAVGTATLFALSGGPNTATCYGDGPDLHLMMRDGGGWREIYSARGRMFVILPTSTTGVRDIADGGPGFSFPVWAWNGTAYASAGREISDAELSNLKVTYLP